MTKPPRQFFAPLASGAPEPLRELPVKLERMIHFVPAHNEKLRNRVGDMANTVDVILANLEDAIPADARTAVYAVGILMYELATGRPPFRGDSFIAVLKKQMYEEPASPRQQVPEQEIPDVFEAVLLRALAKAPGDRFHDLRALDEALLAARAREGELRRVTQILALDPAFWDEDGSRRVKQGSAPQQAADPTPLATFAAILRSKLPEDLAKRFRFSSTTDAVTAVAERMQSCVA